MKKKKNKNVTKAGSNELKNLVILIVVIIVVLIAVYFVTKLFEKKDYSSIFNNSLNTTEIQNKEIIAGTLFQQEGSKYYVLIIDDKDPYSSVLKGYVETYQEADHKIKMYTIDLNNIFNKNLKSEKSNYQKDNLKFKGTTLLEINKKEIKEHIEDPNKISDKLLELNK